MLIAEEITQAMDLFIISFILNIYTEYKRLMMAELGLPRFNLNFFVKNKIFFTNKWC